MMKNSKNSNEESDQILPVNNDRGQRPPELENKEHVPLSLQEKTDPNCSKKSKKISLFKYKRADERDAVGKEDNFSSASQTEKESIKSKKPQLDELKISYECCSTTDMNFFIEVYITFKGIDLTFILDADLIRNSIDLIRNNIEIVHVKPNYNLFHSLVFPNQTFCKHIELRNIDSLHEPTEGYKTFYDLMKQFFGSFIDVDRCTHEKDQEENECGYKALYQLLHLLTYSSTDLDISQDKFDLFCKICHLIIDRQETSLKQLEKEEIKKIISICVKQQSTESNEIMSVPGLPEYLDHLFNDLNEVYNTVKRDDINIYAPSFKMILAALNNCQNCRKLAIVNTEECPGEHWYLALLDITTKIIT